MTVSGQGVDFADPSGSSGVCPTGYDVNLFCTAMATDYTYTLTVSNSSGTKVYTATLTITTP